MINISISEEDAYNIVYYLGFQDKEDTKHIVNKYGLRKSIEEYDESLQRLFTKLNTALELEM